MGQGEASMRGGGRDTHRSRETASLPRSFSCIDSRASSKSSRARTKSKGVPSLPQIVTARSFEQLLSTAQQRAAKRRAREREQQEDALMELPFLDLSLANRNTIKGHGTFLALVEHVHGRAQERSEAARKKAEEEQRKAEEMARMTRLTMLAASALTEKKEEELARGVSKKLLSFKKAKDQVSEEQKRKREDEAILAAAMEREKDPDEVAEMLKPPDFAAILARLNCDPLLAFPEGELQRIQEQFEVYKTPGQSEVHVDRLYELLASLGYTTVEEEMIRRLVQEVTSYSSLDLAELTSFLARYAHFEQATIRKSFHEFDADDSGELSTSEVQAVLQAMGCSPFRGTLQRLIEVVDVNGSGTLDFNEFISLLVVYRQTDGFSHKEIRQIYRTFCRFAVVTDNVRKVPRHRLSSALIFEFGAQAADLARRLANEDTRTMGRAKSLWAMASSASKREKTSGLNFRQFVSWARRMKEAEVGEYVRQFKLYDQSQDGVLDRWEVKHVLKNMGYMPLRSNILDLFQSVDGDGDGTVSLEEYLDMMEYFKRWDGFTGDEAQELETVFKRYANEEGEISTIQIMDILRASGRTTSLRKIRQLVAKVDVDETHSLDLKEFLRLMRLLREEELAQARQAFVLTLKETEGISPEALDEDENLTIDAARLSLPVRLLELNAKNLPSLAERYSHEGRLDLDSFIDVVDQLRQSYKVASKMQASFKDKEVAEFRARFAQCDQDRSGEIDRDEIFALLKPMGIKLEHKDDQRRLMALISEARRWAAESGVPPEECGKTGTANVRFPVFLFICRLLEREKEAKLLAAEEQEARVLGFSEAQVRKMHSKFSFWVMRMQEESGSEDGKDFTLTLSMEGFRKLCGHMNPRLQGDELDELFSVMPSLHNLPAISDDASLAQLLEAEASELPEPAEVGFPVFVRSIKWMLAKDFQDIQEIFGV